MAAASPRPTNCHVVPLVSVPHLEIVIVMNELPYSIVRWGRIIKERWEEVLTP